MLFRSPGPRDGTPPLARITDKAVFRIARLTDPRPDLSNLARMPARRRGGWLWLLVLFAALGLAAWVWTSRTPAAAVSYDTTPVEIGDLIVTVIATGTVQPTTRIDISSELSGTIAAVLVDFNDEVSEGQVLARLDDTNLRARVTTAEAQLARNTCPSWPAANGLAALA